MNILTILKGLVASILLALSGTETPPEPIQITQVVESTNQVVKEVVQATQEPTKDDVTAAYELGKAVGALEAQKETITSKPPTIMTQETPVATPSTPAPTTAPEVATAPAPVESAPAPVAQSQARIEIVSPLSGKGLGRSDYSTEPDFDERGNLRNELYIGVIVYGVDGEPTNTAKVVITATDTDQNKTLDATGNVMSVYVDGQKRQAPYYPFSYQLKTKGEHTIKFSALNLDQSVTVTVN